MTAKMASVLRQGSNLSSIVLTTPIDYRMVSYILASITSTAG